MVADRIESIAAEVQRSMGYDEREALLNSLGELREAYEEGWRDSDEEDEC